MTRWEKTKRFVATLWIRLNLWLEATDGPFVFLAGAAIGFVFGVAVS